MVEANREECKKCKTSGTAKACYLNGKPACEVIIKNLNKEFTTNYYLVDFADYGGNGTIFYKKLVISEIPLSYEDITNKFDFGTIVRIEILDKFEEKS